MGLCRARAESDALRASQKKNSGQNMYAVQVTPRHRRFEVADSQGAPVRLVEYEVMTSGAFIPARPRWATRSR